MNKKIIVGALALSIMFPFFAFRQIASAACANSFYVGADAENVSGCTGLSEGQNIDGFSIDIENNKIVLNNYDGGAIHYFCRGTCASVKSMEIELIGDNIISSQSSNTYLNEHDVPQNAAFINIIPTFTGNGTLKIEAGQPIAFEGNRNPSSFSIDVIGSDFEKNIVESQPQEIEPTAPTVSTSGEDDNGESSTSKSFFETTLGIALLVAVPSILVIIIVILLVALLNKNSKNSPIETIDKSDNSQQF